MSLIVIVNQSLKCAVVILNATLKFQSLKIASAILSTQLKMNLAFHYIREFKIDRNCNLKIGIVGVIYDMLPTN